MEGGRERAARERWPDVYRGIGIVAVVAIHSSGHVLSRMTPYDWNWCAMMSMNRALQFAVPSFLMVSAYLNGASVLRSPGAAAQIALIGRRLRAIGLPYLCASVAGAWTAANFYGRTISVRRFLMDLALGRCEYHLYFVVLLVQLYLALPFAVRLFRRFRRLRDIAVAALGLQVLMFLLNRAYERAPSLHSLRAAFPEIAIDTSLLWYIPSVALGLWLLSQREGSEGKPVPRGVLPRTAALAIAAGAAYLPLAVTATFAPVNTFASQMTEWIYAAAASIFLVAVSKRLAHSAWLAWLGRSSLTIYLAHPFVIEALDRAFPAIHRQPAWSAAALYLIAAIAACLGLAAAGRVLRSFLGRTGACPTNKNRHAAISPASHPRVAGASSQADAALSTNSNRRDRQQNGRFEWAAQGRGRVPSGSTSRRTAMSTTNSRAAARSRPGQ